MTHRDLDFQEAQRRHTEHFERRIERMHRQAAANHLAREAERLRDLCREHRETEAAEWLDSCRTAAQGAIKELSDG